MPAKPTTLFRKWANEEARKIAPAILATTDPDRDEYVGRQMSFREFIPEFWPIVEPGRDFIPNWHIDAIAEHLEAVTNGEIKNLLIAIPPGCMKSLIASVMWPSWTWTEKPSLKYISCSYSLDLATRDSVRTRDIIQSQHYAEVFRPGWRLKGDQNVKSRYETTAGGGRQALSIGSQTTGFRADGWIVDDPLNASAVLEGKVNVTDAVEAANKYIGGVLSTRLNDLRTGFRVVIMQRLHESDAIGFLKESGDFEELILPMEFVTESRYTTSIGWTDPRTERGQLMFPRMFPASELAKKKSPYELGPVMYQAQYQQDPTPAKGDVFDRAWFRPWDSIPQLFAKIISVDCTFKDKKGSDYVVIQVWGAFGTDRFLIEEIRGRMSFTKTKEALRLVYGRHRDCNAVLIEDAANGPAIIDELKTEIPIIIPVTPLGSKLARSMAIQPIAEGLCIYIPPSWSDDEREDWLKEIAGFPKRKHDDRVDAMTQALNYMRKYSVLEETHEAGSFHEEPATFEFEVR